MPSPPLYLFTHNLEEVAAPQLLGAVWNWFLYGVLVVQFYVYSYNFSRDTRFIKPLVYGVFVLETVQTALSGADLYHWFAAGFGKRDYLLSPFLSFIDVPIMGSVISLIVQFFFVYRIWALSSKRWWWLCHIIFICLLSIIGAFDAFAAGVSLYVTEAHQVPEAEWLIANTLSDLLIASAMLYHLERIFTKDGNLSNHVLVRIVRLTVETNLATTTVNIVSLLMVLLFPNKNWYMCPNYVLGKLYSNTLLVSLNNRIAIRDTNSARGGLVNYQVMTGPGISARSGATTETPTSETENTQENAMKQLDPLSEVEVEEGVNSPAAQAADLV